MPVAPTQKPRIRAADGSFAARGTLTGKLLRKVWSSPFTNPAAVAAPLKPLKAFEAQVTPIEFFASFTADKVDKTNAIIRGVSVITNGVIARGHDLEVDDKTLKQIQNCAEEKNQVPVKVNHKSGAEAVCGYLTNFTIDGDKLKADWHLLHTHPQKDTILEVAERMPGGVGLSASFLPPAKGEKAASGKKAARCEELISVDYVTLPAANPGGMFSQGPNPLSVDSTKNTNPQPMNITPDIQAAIDAAVQAATAPLTEQIQALQNQADLTANPPDLADLAEMSEDELADLGLTADEVNEAIEAHNAEVEAQGLEQGDEAGESEGYESSEGEGELATAGAGDGSTGLQSVLSEVRELGAQLRHAKANREAAEQEQVLTDLAARYDDLIAQNIELREALQSGGQAASNGVATVNFKSKHGVAINFGTKEPGQFEEAVANFLESTPNATKAIAFSTIIKDQPEAYRDYRVRCGGIKG